MFYVIVGDLCQRLSLFVALVQYNSVRVEDKSGKRRFTEFPTEKRFGMRHVFNVLGHIIGRFRLFS